jgi:hypothetical protein
MEGRFQHPADDMQIIDRIGLDGTGLRRVGRRGLESTIITTTEFATSALADTEGKGYAALQSTAPAIVDQHGIARAGWTVFLVELGDIIVTGIVTGPLLAASSGAILTVRWVLRKTTGVIA